MAPTGTTGTKWPVPKTGHCPIYLDETGRVPLLARGQPVGATLWCQLPSTCPSLPSLRRSRASSRGSLVPHITDPYQRKGLPQPLLAGLAQATLVWDSPHHGTLKPRSRFDLATAGQEVSPYLPASQPKRHYIHTAPTLGARSNCQDDLGDGDGEGGCPCKQAAARRTGQNENPPKSRES